MLKGKMNKMDLVLTAIAHPDLVSYIADIISVPEDDLRNAVNLSRENIRKAITAFKKIGINISKRQIKEIIKQKENNLELLYKFYKKHPDIIIRENDLLFELILYKKIELEEVPIEELRIFLDWYADEISEEYKLAITREIHRKQLKIAKQYEELYYSSGTILEALNEEEKLEVMQEMSIEELLKAPLSLFKDIFKVLQKRYGDKMWSQIANEVNESNLAMVITLITLADSDFSMAVAKRILKEKKNVLREPFTQILSVIANIKKNLTLEELHDIIEAYEGSEEALIQILKVLYENAKLTFNMIYRGIANRPKLAVKLASAIGVVQELPKDIIFALAERAPELFFISPNIPEKLKLEFAATFINLPESKEYVKEVIDKKPTALEPYLFHILTNAPELIPHAINLGANLTRIALYALARIATQEHWETRRIIKELGPYEKICPADIKGIIESLKKKIPISDVLENTIGALDKKFTKQYTLSAIKSKYEDALKELDINQLIYIFINSILRYISLLPLPQKVSALEKVLSNLDVSLRVQLMRLIPNFSLDDVLSRVMHLPPNGSDKDAREAFANTAGGTEGHSNLKKE